MATVITQASASIFKPCASKSRFLNGSSTKLNRQVSVSFTSMKYPSSTSSFKVQARNAEWLPGLDSPTYLTGSLPGDNGFDPLGLAEKPEDLTWFFQGELVNSRWAMLGVAGMLVPQIINKVGGTNFPEWFDAGKEQYFASSSTLLVIEFLLFNFAELRRLQDIKNPGSVNQDPIFKQYSLAPHVLGYPGGFFNPLNLEPTLEAKERELANGRLAMLAFLGLVVQYSVTGKGPFENLLQHISDPSHNSIIQKLSAY
ncbi:putative chlorophyll A-B binding protein [Lupinus albus]|uniref:Chlorophyll a-b binding protein, chloroplastic n=1 Tax=Lupinus albus TaxID=3870 RepID=A0A6A4PKZ8_LUPAL|nr:putative chlorophyll A-B binding protein [Lupinus albus]